MIINFSEFLNESISNKNIICYHRSNDYNHMKNNDFSLEYANNNDSIFGRAIYFASSPDISYQLGKYMCKFRISLNNPLNMNIELSNDDANELLAKYVKKYNIKIKYFNRDLWKNVDRYDFSDDFDNVQYGEFFLQLQEIFSIHDEPLQHIYDFIKNELKYNSFYHYCDYGTNFITEKGDYGYCYGVYNSDDIKFIE